MAKRKAGSSAGSAQREETDSNVEEGEIREYGDGHQKRRKIARREEGRTTLMGLPPELRNHIYRFALVDETGDLRVDAGHRLQPGLLRTCRQIREEATNIFFLENTFRINSIGLAPPVPERHWLTTRKSTRTVTIALPGPWDWANLKGWLRRCHQTGGYFNLRRDGTASKRIQVAAQTLCIMEALKVVPCDAVDKMLEEYKIGTGLCVGSWAWT
ncbi:hypothetical protein LTR85_008923 [Meristemomyces frigidus]|nr:hypothetical protein LTR85_008923 [Meristemomyces frigidus]